MSQERLFFRNHLLGSSCQRIWIKNYKRRFVPSQTEQEAKTFQSLIADLGFGGHEEILFLPDESGAPLRGGLCLPAG